MRYRFEISEDGVNSYPYAAEDNNLTDFMNGICRFFDIEPVSRMYIDKMYDDGSMVRYMPGGEFNSDLTRLSYVLEFPGEEMIFYCGYSMFVLRLKSMSF